MVDSLLKLFLSLTLILILVTNSHAQIQTGGKPAFPHGPAPSFENPEMEDFAHREKIQTELFRRFQSGGLFAGLKRQRLNLRVCCIYCF